MCVCWLQVRYMSYWCIDQTISGTRHTVVCSAMFESKHAAATAAAETGWLLAHICLWSRKLNCVRIRVCVVRFCYCVDERGISTRAAAESSRTVCCAAMLGVKVARHSPVSWLLLSAPFKLFYLLLNLDEIDNIRIQLFSLTTRCCTNYTPSASIH